MRLKITWISSLALLVLCALVWSTSVNAVTEARNYGFDVSISPEHNHTGIYHAKFTVTDLNAGTVVAAPTIRFRAGEPASASAVDESGVAFDCSVSVDKEASMAQYQVKVLSGNSVISSSQARIALLK